VKVVIYGAGSIGCYLGAVLAKQNIDVVLLGRDRLKAIVDKRGGVQITDYQGRNDFVKAMSYHTQPEVLAQADVVLVTLKCTAMEEAASVLAQHCKPGALVVCLQNGVGAEKPVLDQVKRAEVCCGIVPFNVVQGDNAQFHRATEGTLHLPAHPSLNTIAEACVSYGLPCELSSDMPTIIWGKLLLNLNNAINAISDLPLKEQLSQRGYRRVLAACQMELLAACEKKDIPLAQLTAVKPKWLPKILNLPDWLFRIVAQKMLAIDPQARSSMWEDIQAQRPTEIDYLNGAVVALAKDVGVPSPANTVVLELLKAVSDAKTSPPISSEEILSRLSEE